MILILNFQKKRELFEISKFFKCKTSTHSFIFCKDCIRLEKGYSFIKLCIFESFLKEYENT